MTSLPEETVAKLIALSQEFPERFSKYRDRIGPNDRRLTDIRHDDLVYELPAFRSLDEWQARAAWLRQHVLVSNGLWPLPERTPLNAVVFGRIERDEYSVEKVYFESFPGFLVTGNLYRPLDRSGLLPGVLNPHGHWPHGRLAHDSSGSVPARCINFARQGYVAFTYDMIGFVDSTQVPHYNVPDRASQFPFLDVKSPGQPARTDLRDQLWGISLAGLQLWNSIRSVDFLGSLPDVDSERLGCTGASGGGTQTFLLTAVDDRIKVSAPVNMISAHFQGGCICENPPNLRLDTSNLEIAALTAPRPMLMVSASGDWTTNTPTIEYPALRAIYQLFGAEDQLEWIQIDAGHNYNLQSREPVYRFFGRLLLESEDAGNLTEVPVTVEKSEDLRVFAGADRPSTALTAEGVSKQFIRRADDEFDSLWPRKEMDLGLFREVYGPALHHTLATEWPEEVLATRAGSTGWSGLSVEKVKLDRPGRGDELPAVSFSRADSSGSRTALVIHSGGNAALVDLANLRPGAMLHSLLEAGYNVLAVDVFLTGEYHTPWATGGRHQHVRYFTTYNRTDDALRVQDVLTSLSYLTQRTEGGEVDVIGIGDGGLWCLLARAVAPISFRIVADVSRFAAADDASYFDRLYIPGLRKAGGFPSALALAAPSPTLIHNSGGVFNAQEADGLYASLGQSAALTIRDEELSPQAIVEWLGT